MTTVTRESCLLTAITGTRLTVAGSLAGRLGLTFIGWVSTIWLPVRQAASYGRDCEGE
jgi:hypothetical protein